MTNEALLDHVADIVSAHVSNNAVPVGDLPGLIRSVYASLVALGKPAKPVPETLTPAVSIRASLRADAMTCLECGDKLTILKRHLGTEHGLTPADYRARWNLPADYPMVAPNYAAKRKELAMRFGLGRKPKAAVPDTPVKSPKVAKPRKATVASSGSAAPEG